MANKSESTMLIEGRNLSTLGFCLKIGLVMFFFALICAIVVLAWVPPVSRDALTHHLAVPKLYLQHGGIYEIPSIAFSYYPMNLDLLYIVPLYFKNDIAPKFIHFAFALLTAGLIFSYLRKRLDPLWALAGSLFFLSVPIIVKLSITVYVDLGLVFFSTASLMGLLKWVESRFRIKFLMLSAVCCGLALGTKYNGLLVLFILTVVVPLVFIRKAKGIIGHHKPGSRRDSIRIQFAALGYGAIFFTTALLVFSPWMIRNYAWTKNPVYPLYHHWFNPKNNDPGETLVVGSETGPEDDQVESVKRPSAKWGSFALRKLVYNETWWEIASIPVRIFFQGRDDNPKYFDGKLSPFLLLLPFFAFFQFKNNPPALMTEKKILVLFTILFILYAFSQTDMRIRYVAPIVPPLVILATFGLRQIATLTASGRWIRLPAWLAPCAALLLLAAALSVHAAYIVKQFNNVRPFDFIAGDVDRDAYITRYRPEYSVYQYANKNLPDTSKILGLFLGNRRYYSDRDLTFDNNLLRDIIKTADTPEAISDSLQAIGYSHLLIRFDLFNRWADKQFDDREKRIMIVFFEEYAKPLLSRNGYGLFALNTAAVR